LAFHDSAGRISINNKEDIGLDELADLAGNLEVKIIFFASCSTMRPNKGRFFRFFQNTKATAVFGYKSQVDWLPATIFELIVLQELQISSITIFKIRQLQKRLDSIQNALF
jgi:hypothetical protein